jgi:hypothetical protein
MYGNVTMKSLWEKMYRTGRNIIVTGKKNEIKLFNEN